MLVPALSQGAAGELADVLAACDAAVADLVQAGAGALVVVVAAGPTTTTYPSDGPAGWHPLGVAQDVEPLGREQAAGPRLPISLAVGRWLLSRSPYAGGRDVSWRVSGADAAGWGRQVAASGETTALLVLGEGSACLGSSAPLPADARGAGLDAAVLSAVADGDPVALLRLDPVLAHELGASGCSPWRALGAAVGGRTVRSGPTSYAAPYGVGYLVGSWRVG